MIMFMSYYIANTIMCCECNYMCYLEVCSSEVGTIVECCIASLVMVRSGTIIVVVSLLIWHASYCISVLKEASHGFRSGDPKFISGGLSLNEEPFLSGKDH